MWVGQRRYDLVVQAAGPAARRRQRDPHRCSSTATTARAFRSASSPPIEQTFGPAAIRREAGSRRIAVEATVSGRDLASTAADGAAAPRPELELPPGYFFTVGGRVESQARATRALLIAIAAALLAVFVLLHLAARLCRPRR